MFVLLDPPKTQNSPGSFKERLFSGEAAWKTQPKLRKEADGETHRQLKKAIYIARGKEQGWASLGILRAPSELSEQGDHTHPFPFLPALPSGQMTFASCSGIQEYGQLG